MLKIGVLSPLSVDALPKKGQWVLRKPLKFNHPLCGLNEVPSGFKTDLASIPLFFRRIFSVNDRHREEAVVHDYLYSIRGQFPGKKLSRKQCDQIFNDLMKVDDISAWKRKLIVTAVRMFGGAHLKRTSGVSWN